MAQRTMRLPGVKTWWGGAVYVTPEQYAELTDRVVQDRVEDADQLVAGLLGLRQEFEDLEATYADFENAYAEGQHDSWHLAERKLADLLATYRVPGPSRPVSDPQTFG